MISRATKGLVLLALSPLIALCHRPYVGLMAGTRDFGTLKQGLASVGEISEGPKAVFPEARFQFGKVISGDMVEHEFVVKNEGSAPLLIQKVSMTTPLLVTQMSQEVAPGAEGRIHFKLDTANLAGRFEGAILVFLNDPALPKADLCFVGHIVPAIQLSPMPAFFVAGQRSQGGRAAIEIVNCESEPLRIKNNRASEGEVHDGTRNADMGARIENCNRRSDVAVAPALKRTASNAPGSAKRNISGEPGVGAVDATYRSTTCDTV